MNNLNVPHLKMFKRFHGNPPCKYYGFDDPAYKDRRIKIDAIKIEVANLMAQNKLDALVFPHPKGPGCPDWRNESAGH